MKKADLKTAFMTLSRPEPKMAALLLRHLGHCYLPALLSSQLCIRNAASPRTTPKGQMERFWNNNTVQAMLVWSLPAMMSACRGGSGVALSAKVFLAHQLCCSLRTRRFIQNSCNPVSGASTEPHS